MLPKNKLEKLYKSGLLIKEISEKEGWEYNAVKYWMTKYNIPRRSASETCYRAYWNRQKENPLFSGFDKATTVKVVRELYYKKKLSAREVGNTLGRSMNSIYGFMRRNNMSCRVPVETNNIVYERQKLSYNLKKKLTFKDQKLKIAGIMLYWAEGAKSCPYKKYWTVDFANSDPEMIKVFLKFLREICGVDKDRLRVSLYCYANQDIESLKQYWYKITKIPLKQFTKPYVRQDFLPEKKGKMKYGLVHIKYSDKKLLLQINDWTKQYLNKMV